MLNIFAHYEAGFDYHLETHLRETYKFLIKMNDLHAVQKAMIRFVRNLGDIYPHEIKSAFKKLYRSHTNVRRSSLLSSEKFVPNFSEVCVYSFVS